jgi:hypothetical protein
MSCRHEQKHLLHNWSDCRYRDRPQSPRAVLEFAFALETAVEHVGVGSDDLTG